MKKKPTFGLKPPKPKAKNQAPTADVFRRIDVDLLELVAIETAVDPERIMQLALATALACWFSYTEDDDGEVHIAVDDLPSEPDLLTHTQGLYHRCFRKPRPK